jgi:acetyltransferase-like isoleucine patch superfamily enzyme
MGVACIVVPGVTIGDGCVIGANSIVTRNLDPYTFAAGAPARPIRDLRDELTRSDDASSSLTG